MYNLNSILSMLFEPRHEKTNFLHMQKKDADQLCSKPEADQCLCFRYTDTTIPLLAKSEVIFCDCTAWFVSNLVRTPEDRFGFLTTRL